jgi:hypothetical protein
VWPPPPNQQYGFGGGYVETVNSGDILATAIFSFICFGFVLGPWAIIKAIAAMDAGRADPRDRGKVVTARVIAVIGTIFYLLAFISRVGRFASH